MPILNHTLTTTEQEGGWTHNTLRMYDQDAREFMESWRSPPGFDNAARAAGTIIGVDEQFAEAEFEALIGSD